MDSGRGAVPRSAIKAPCYFIRLHPPRLATCARSCCQVLTIAGCFIKHQRVAITVRTCACVLSLKQGRMGLVAGEFTDFFFLLLLYVRVFIPFAIASTGTYSPNSVDDTSWVGLYFLHTYGYYAHFCPCQQLARKAYSYQEFTAGYTQARCMKSTSVAECSDPKLLAVCTPPELYVHSWAPLSSYLI